MKRLSAFLIVSWSVLVLWWAAPAMEVETPPRALDEVKHPEWSYNIGIYEVNVRQYSPGGTFRGFERHLPRLKEMGIGILWFMPIHPIGEKNRKGSLGSYYSVRDYYRVNPEFGTLDDFRALVDRIHDMGMYIIIDWVANHSAWDNSLTEDHPDWYLRDSFGNFKPPVADWWDVIGFDYRNRDLRRYMIDAMRFWVEDVGIDGFRCDVAGMVPLDFWEAARAELEAVRPVFMLAEWESPAAHRAAFDMTYAWDLMGTMNEIGQNKATAEALDGYLQRESQTYSRDDFRMLFTTNHDENSWNGTVFDRLGDGARAFAVLSATLPGMPLVYSGQEAALSKKLDFFEKDLIPWGDYSFQSLYSTLLCLKQRNRALWNGEAGGLLERIYTSDDKSVFAFIRRKHGDGIFAVFNLSGFTQAVKLSGDSYLGPYRDVFAKEDVTLSAGAEMEIEPWGYRLYEVVRHEGGSDIDALYTYMTGSFSSRAQAEADSEYLDIRLEMVPIWSGRSDGYWLYVEQAVAAYKHRPYRQRVYHLIEQDDGSISSEVYSFENPPRYAGDWKKDEPFGGLSPDSLMVREGCAVVLRRTPAGIFEGSTVEKQCVNDLRGAVYATSEVTVTRDRLTIWDRGFDGEDSQVWGAIKGPYIFLKLE
jgi:cyclomaltodextrinase